jgi:hypothetical protein
MNTSPLSAQQAPEWMLARFLSMAFPGSGEHPQTGKCHRPDGRSRQGVGKVRLLAALAAVPDPRARRGCVIGWR